MHREELSSCSLIWRGLEIKKYRCQEMLPNSLYILLVMVWLFSVCSHGHPAMQLSKKTYNSAVMRELHREIEKEENTIMIDLTSYVYEVSDQFLSVTIGAEAIKHNWHRINFTAPRVINMAKALAPAMLRVGGTSEDALIFEETTELDGKESNFTMNTTEWDAVNMFVEAVVWDIIFGLNVLLRKNGAWDSANAEELLTYTTSKGYKVNWELGNEPNNFPAKFNTSVSAPQLAKDFEKLKSLVAEKSPATRFIAGPDINSRSKLLPRFLEDIDHNVLNAVTWHHYYTNGRTATLPDFYSVSLLDHFIFDAKVTKMYVGEYQPGTELWLGETSSTYGGGTRGLSDAYVAGFMWLDKLGIAALTNHTRVFRQTFVGGAYGLLDSDQYPLPDYWLSVLYKRLVGTRVLNVTNALEEGRYVRAYAHCAKTPYPVGSVVLLLLNLHTYDTTATLSNSELASGSRDVYWLTPPGTNVESQQVTLNGHLLQLVDNTSLPELEPVEQEASDTISLPALSFGFQVFKEANAQACM